MLNQANARQIKNGVITNQHIAAGAAISESKLNIDWAARTADILGSRTVVDFVQVDGVAVNAGVSSVNVAGRITPPAATADTDRGAVVQDGKNRVVLRNAANGEPIIGASGKEVYAKLTKPAADYVLVFFTKDANGAEVPHAMTSAVTIDLQYPQRFDLNTVSETFAANEKFVDGAADVSERLDLQQIVKDVFGGTYALTHTGVAANAKTVIQQLIEEIEAREDADTALQGAIDAEVTARTNAVNGVGIRVTAVENEILAARGSSASLAEELARIEGAGSQSNTEIVAARNSAITGAHASLDERLEAGETRYEAVKSEVETARNGKASLNAELSAIRTSVANEVTARADADTALGNRATALEGKAHGHFAEDKQVLVGDPLIGNSVYTLQNVNKFVAGNMSLQVYINGFLQMAGVHYTEIEAGGAGTGGTGVTFAPEVIEQGDVIQLRWSK